LNWLLCLLRHVLLVLLKLKARLVQSYVPDPLFVRLSRSWFTLSGLQKINKNLDDGLLVFVKEGIVYAWRYRLQTLPR
jgi:hypothetical protein